MKTSLLLLPLSIHKMPSYAKLDSRNLLPTTKRDVVYNAPTQQEFDNSATVAFHQIFLKKVGCRIC